MMRLRTIWLAFIGILSAICIAGSIWADNTVFIQATDSTVRRIARELQYQAKAQIEVEAGKDRKVSLNLTDVSLEAALDALTAAAGLTWERRGERYVITLQPEVIRLITYNIFDGGRQGVRPFARLELLAEVIGTAEPDAVMLQEADGWDADGYAASQEFARLTGLQRFFVAPGNSGHATALFSRLKTMDAVNRSEEGFRHSCLEAVVTTKRDTQLVLLTTQLAAGRAEKRRVEDIERILKLAAGYAGLPRIIAGTLNAWSPEDSPPERAATEAIQKLLDAGFSDAYRLLHKDAPGYTEPVVNPRWRNDYVFVSPELKDCVARCEPVTSGPVREASDHLPVLLELHLPARFASREALEAE